MYKNAPINSPLHWGQKYEPISQQLYELKYNKSIDYNTRKLLDKYLKKKKLLEHLRYNYGIIL